MLFPFITLVLLLAFSFTLKDDTLTGSWVIKFSNNETVQLNFRNNGTVKVVIPSDNFTVEGKYKLKNNVLSLNDGTCGLDYWGKYRITFFSKDSVYTVMMEDSCGPRKAAMDKATLTKVKM